MLIDAKGQHLTTGLIDLAASGLRRPLGYVDPERPLQWRLEDALVPRDPQIYRLLAQGVTTAQLLMTEAGAIAPQPAVIKLRWGATAQKLLLKAAQPSLHIVIKGAGIAPEGADSRATREMQLSAAFTAAQQYKNTWTQHQKKSKKPAPKRDLYLEAISEALDGRRRLICTAETKADLTLARALEEQFKFRTSMFTHLTIDEAKSSNQIASSAEKARQPQKHLPYRIALMQEGTSVALHASSTILRLNELAAEAARYEKLTEIEAWKSITLNPARSLGLEAQLGSIRIGKSADLVLWSSHPLSSYAKVEKTFIDGRLYYDRSKQQQQTNALTKDRNRLIQQILHASIQSKHSTSAHLHKRTKP